MTRKNTIVLLACLLTAFFVLSLGVLVFFYAYLPTYVESRVIPKIARDMGLETVACRVRRIGVTGADMGSLQIGPLEHPALTIDSIQLDYTPGGLLSGHIKKVLLSGIVLCCEIENSTFAVCGLNPDTLFAKTGRKGRTTKETKDSLFPISVGNLEIRNAVVACSREGKEVRLPVGLRIAMKEKAKNGVRYALFIDVGGQKLFSEVQMLLEEKTVELAFDADGVALERLVPLATVIPGFSIWGKGDLHGKARIGLEPFSVMSASMSCQVRDGGAGFEGMWLKTVSKGGTETLPCRIQLDGEGDVWSAHVSAVSLPSRVPLVLKDFRSTVKKGPLGLETTGDGWLHVESFAQERPGSVGLLEPFRLKGRYRGVVRQKGAWEFSLATEAIDPSGPASQDVEIAAGGFRITSRPPELHVNAKGTGGHGSASYKVAIPDFTAQNSEKARMTVPLVGLKGQIDFPASGQISVGFDLEVPNTEVGVSSAKVAVPQASLEGRLSLHHGTGMRLDGHVRFDNARMMDPELGADVGGVKANLPFTWPKEGLGEKGAFFVDTLRWKGLNVGNVKGTVRQKGLGVVFEGWHENALLPGLTLAFGGTSQIVSGHGHETKIDFEVAPYTTLSPVDMGRFQRSLKDVSLTGSVALGGNWRFDSRGGQGAFHGKFYDGRLEMGEEQKNIDGLAIELSSFDLGTMRSAPLQQLVFKTAAFGGVTLSDGRLGFQIESAKSLFIEKGSVKWCGGNVYTEAIRLSSDGDFYDMVLYGDRLDLAMVLEQFGVATGKGRGTVNGRIPVRLGKGKIRFGDGFLFSTPGDGGTIRLSGTEMLTEGIPPNTPQFAQLELAREALKDFDYEWAKVTLVTEGDILVLRMQLDGKPANPLPFVYETNLGSFVKMKEGGQSSVFKGIRLDVNFRLPLERLLHYSDIFQNIFRANE